MHKLDEEVGDILKHFGVVGMRWGSRKSGGGSRAGSGSKGSSKTPSKKVNLAKTLVKGVAMALGVYHGNPNTKLTGKAEKRVGDVLHYTLGAAGGGLSSSRNHRAIGDKRVIGKGEKVVSKHLDHVVRVGGALSNLI